MEQHNSHTDNTYIKVATLRAHISMALDLLQKIQVMFDQLDVLDKPRDENDAIGQAAFFAQQHELTRGELRREKIRRRGEEIQRAAMAKKPVDNF